MPERVHAHERGHRQALRVAVLCHHQQIIVHERRQVAEDIADARGGLAGRVNARADRRGRVKCATVRAGGEAAEHGPRRGVEQAVAPGQAGVHRALAGRQVAGSVRQDVRLL